MRTLPWAGGPIRIGLDRPAILRQQLRALIRAAAERPLSIMFPMISEVAEFEAARRLLERELTREERLGGPLPREIRLGVMLEVPALAWQISALSRCADFMSVGSNDLFQFLFASDRGNPQISRRYDVLSPPVLKFFKEIAEQAGQAGLPLSICGEMAGHPLEAMALIGCGFRSLSMAPPRGRPGTQSGATSRYPLPSGLRLQPARFTGPQLARCFADLRTRPRSSDIGLGSVAFSNYARNGTLATRGPEFRVLLT